MRISEIIDEAKKVPRYMQDPKSTQADISKPYTFRWYESDIVFKKYEPTPELMEALVRFMQEKVRWVRDSFGSKSMANVSDLLAYSSDRGRFKHPQLADFDHYHLAVPRGDRVLFYEQKFNNSSRTIDIYLTKIGDHSDYARSQTGSLSTELAKARTTYKPMPTKA